MESLDNISITDAKIDEVEDILSLKNKVWEEIYPNEKYNITKEDIVSRKEDDHRRLISMREGISDQSDRYHAWVAKYQEKIIGMCVAEKGLEINRLNALYILPEYRKLGLGSKFMEAVFYWLGSDKDICLGVAEYNIGAIKFYEKFDFYVNGLGENIFLRNNKKIPVLEMIKIALR